MPVMLRRGVSSVCGSAGLVAGGGKLDAKVRLWRPAQWHGGDTGAVVLDAPAKELAEPGYCFDLEVLPYTAEGSDVFALAGARYNAVRICL